MRVAPVMAATGYPTHTMTSLTAAADRPTLTTKYGLKKHWLRVCMHRDWKINTLFVIVTIEQVQMKSQSQVILSAKVLRFCVCGYGNGACVGRVQFASVLVWPWRPS